MIHKIEWVLLVMIAVFCCGCTRNGTVSQIEDHGQGHGTIAISYLTGENPFFTTVAETITKKASEAGYTVTSVDAENNPFLQTRQVQQFITSKVIAIVLIPCNSKEIGPAVREANAAGIPVFTADVAVQDPLAKVVCHVATDNYAGGKLAAEELLESMGREGQVAIVDWPGIESVQQRTKGFREVMAFAKKEGVQIEVVSCMPAYGSREKAKLAMREILNDFPNLDAVFAINDPTGFGILDVLKEKGLEKQVKIVSFDGSKEAKLLVDQGSFYADIVQNPNEIGNIMFEVIHKHLKNLPVSSQVLIPTKAYRGNNLKKEKD